jgi:uronate dehydrogenase
MLNRLLITGAAGHLGTQLRAKLADLATHRRLTDIAAMTPAGPNEEVIQADIGDLAAVRALVDGCDGIVHLGGISRENTFDAILHANLRGVYNVFEAARGHGRPRVLFASSNHAIGFHERESRLDAASPYRPDSLYGLSKCYGELMGRYYFDKFGVESVSVRIGSCFDAPSDRRMLATWLSIDDLAALVRKVFQAPRVGCTVLYGASANAEQWWDNGHAGFLGWRPRDTSEPWRAAMEALPPLPADDPAVRFQGGGFAKAGHFEDQGG